MNEVTERQKNMKGLREIYAVVLFKLYIFNVFQEVLFWSPDSQTINFTGGTAEANEIRDMSKIPL